VRDKLDAARLKLSTITPDTPAREVERIIHHLALTCSMDELAGLISDALDAEAQARKELIYSQARLKVLTDARKQKRQG
jgi:hypothetical protein